LSNWTLAIIHTGSSAVGCTNNYSIKERQVDILEVYRAAKKGVAERGLTEVIDVDSANVRNSNASSLFDELAAVVPVLKPEIRTGASLVTLIQ
jgi:hypothetical protein